MAIGVFLIVTMTMAGAQTAIPRSEHPRPDRMRAGYASLNGTWEFAETDDSNDLSFLSENSKWVDRINVPFCRESKLSGLGRKGFVKNVWYRRLFDLDSNWMKQRTFLHLGACDWRTTVWVNGQEAGTHTGGQAPIDLDITKFARQGKNQVIVHAFDDTRSGIQALGKQCNELNSYGCLYTRTTGIWQPVWLESVGNSYIDDFVVKADLAGSRFMIDTKAVGFGPGMTIRIEAFDGKRKVATGETLPGSPISLTIPNAKWWSPKSPFLYNLKMTLRSGTKVIDTVESYAGMREVLISGGAILINGEPVFQRLVLDQGFYPDGVWTAPTDQALKDDIEMSMAAGFNGARLHQKVFEPRYLYWADRLGYLVWGEFPNWGLDYKNPAINLPVLEEWSEVVRRDRNHPAIIGWCPFNETPADAVPIQNAVVKETWVMDPTRPVIDSSGYAHGLPTPKVLDAHDYDQNPVTFKARWDRMLPRAGADLPSRFRQLVSTPFFVSEYGGIGWSTGDGWGYGNAPKTLEEFYVRLKGLSDALLDNNGMFGFCYTQLTDVEQERNGIYTFDRKAKFDVKRVHDIFARKAKYEVTPPLPEKKPAAERSWSVLVGSNLDASIRKQWKYATDQPADNWYLAKFDDSAWKTGFGAFGAKGGYEAFVLTPWASSDLWIRQTVVWDGADYDKAILAIHYDNATEVLVNGSTVWRSEPKAWNDNYEPIDITKALQGALVKGENQIAAHCHQDSGGQFLDFALILRGAKIR